MPSVNSAPAGSAWRCPLTHLPRTWTRRHQAHRRTSSGSLPGTALTILSRPSRVVRPPASHPGRQRGGGREAPREAESHGRQVAAGWPGGSPRGGTRPVRTRRRCALARAICACGRPVSPVRYRRRSACDQGQLQGRERPPSGRGQAGRRPFRQPEQRLCLGPLASRSGSPSRAPRRKRAAKRRTRRPGRGERSAPLPQRL